MLTSGLFIVVIMFSVYITVLVAGLYLYRVRGNHKRSGHFTPNGAEK